MEIEKTDHEHAWEWCLIRKNLDRYDLLEERFINYDTLIKGVHCTTCGALGEKQYRLTVPADDRHGRVLIDPNEIRETYKDLPIF